MGHLHEATEFLHLYTMSSFLVRTATRPGHTTRLSTPGHTTRVRTTTRNRHTTDLSERRFASKRQRLRSRFIKESRSHPIGRTAFLVLTILIHTSYALIKDGTSVVFDKDDVKDFTSLVGSNKRKGTKPIWVIAAGGSRAEFKPKEKTDEYGHLYTLTVHDVIKTYFTNKDGDLQLPKE